MVYKKLRFKIYFDITFQAIKCKILKILPASTSGLVSDLNTVLSRRRQSDSNQLTLFSELQPSISKQ